MAGRWLANDIRTLRIDAGLTRTQVGKELGCSSAKLGHLETGHTPIRRADLLVMLPMYGVSESRRGWYLDLCDKARQKGWWDGDSGVPSWFSLYVGLEWGAEKIRCFDLGFVPGLLQTPDYARAVVAAEHPVDPEQTERVVAQRVQRQAALTREEHPLHLHATLDEAAIRREAGSRAIMRAQWSRLIEVSEHPQVDLQIVPFSAGTHPGQLGTFSILNFPNSDDPGVVYLETRRGGLYLEENDELEDFSSSFAKLADLALGRDESVEFLKKLMRSRA